MPTDIAERIDAALAAEALLDATAPAETEHVSRETASASVVPEPVHADRPAGRPRAATGPGRGRPARRRRRHAVLGAVLGAAAVGVSVLLFQAAQPSMNDTAGSKKPDTTSSTARDTMFSGMAVEDRVESLLTAEEGTGPDKTPPRSRSLDNQSSPSTMFSEDVTVPSCIQAGTGRSDQALAAQPGTYEGRQAYLVVMPHPTDPSHVQAYVVDASCISKAQGAKADVLLTHAYPRP
ncbi:hypothetical protein [Streptomyces ficellus]